MLVLLLVGCCSIVGQFFRFSAHVRFRLSCCEFFGVNRDSPFLRVQQSGQATVSPDHLLVASDGSEHFLLVSEHGSSDFVQLGDVVHDEEDVSLASSVGGFHTDDAGLFRVEVASGALEDGLLLAQGGGGGLLFGGQISLGGLQLGSEFGLLLGRLGLQSVELLLSFIGELLGGLDSLHISKSHSAHAFDGGGEAGLLAGEIGVDSLDGFAVGDSAGQHALDQLDGDDQIHTEVDEGPLDTFRLVFLLLLDEHVVVEELLETLVGVVDKELFQDVELKDLEAGNVQDTNEILPRVGRVDRVVDKSNNPIEHTGEERLGSGGNGESHLLQILTLLHEIFADLQLGLHEGVDEKVDLNLKQISGLGNKLHAVGLGLLLTTLLLPLLVTQVSDGNGALVQTILLILVEAKGVQGLVRGAHLLGVIHTGDGQHALSEEEVISGEGLVAQLAELPVLGVSIGHQLVEDMVISFNLQLEGDTGLLQKVGLDISGGDFGGGAEVDTDELSESGGVVVTDGLGVAVSLQRRVGLDNLLLERTGVLTLGSLGLGRLGIGAVQSVVLQDFLGVLGLSSARLASDQRRLMLVLHLKELQSTVSDGVQMRWGLVSSSVSEMGSHDGSVHHQPFVRVDANTEETRIGVDLETLVTRPQVEEDARLVEDGQVGHILLQEEFWGVAFKDFSFGEAESVAIFSLDIAWVLASGDGGLDVDQIGICDPALSLGIERRGPLGHKLSAGGLEPDPIWMLRTQLFYYFRHGCCCLLSYFSLFSDPRNF